MHLNEYQDKASSTASFGDLPIDPLYFLTIGLTGEAGEFAEKIKKIIRNDNGIMSTESRNGLNHELGDVLWYISQLANVLEFDLQDVAEANITKLTDRKKRDVIKSVGDNR